MKKWGSWKVQGKLGGPSYKMWNFSRLWVLLSMHRVKGAGMLLSIFGVFHVMLLFLLQPFFMILSPPNCLAIPNICVAATMLRGEATCLRTQNQFPWRWKSGSRMHCKVLLKPDKKKPKEKQKYGKEMDSTKPRKKPNQTKNCLVFLISLLQLLEWSWSAETIANITGPQCQVIGCQLYCVHSPQIACENAVLQAASSEKRPNFSHLEHEITRSQTINEK